MDGCVKFKWPHRDGLTWPHRRTLWQTLSWRISRLRRSGWSPRGRPSATPAGVPPCPPGLVLVKAESLLQRLGGLPADVGVAGLAPQRVLAQVLHGTARGAAR